MATTIGLVKGHVEGKQKIGMLREKWDRGRRTMEAQRNVARQLGAAGRGPRSKWHAEDWYGQPPISPHCVSEAI